MSTTVCGNVVEANHYINGVGEWDEEMRVYVKKQINSFYEVIKSILEDLNKFDKDIHIGFTTDDIDKLIKEANRVPKGKGLTDKLLKAKQTFDSVANCVKEISGLPTLSHQAWKRELEPECIEELVSIFVRPRSLRVMEDFPLYQYTGYFKLRREIVSDVCYPEWVKWPSTNQDELVKFIKLESGKFNHILLKNEILQFDRVKNAGEFINGKAEKLAHRIKALDDYFIRKHKQRLLKNPNNEDEGEVGKYFMHGRTIEELDDDLTYTGACFALEMLLPLYERVMQEAAEKELPNIDQICKPNEVEKFNALMVRWNRIFDIAEDRLPNLHYLRKACNLWYTGQIYKAQTDKYDLMHHLKTDIVNLESIVSMIPCWQISSKD